MTTVMNDPRCEPCQVGRHGGCVKSWVDCTCFAYHHEIRPTAPFGRVRHFPAYSDLDELDVLHDRGDGGLGSGRYLTGEMP